MSDPAAGSERAAQLLAWASAYGVALYAYHRSTRFGRQRFVLALWAGAAFAHLGWAMLHLPQVIDRPQLLLHPGAVSVLFAPLGVLVVAPWREALAALPLALAISRLGCLAYTCCYAMPANAIVELGGLLLLHLGARRWPEHTAPIVLSGFGLVRLVSTPLRVEPHPGLFVDPMWIAGLWIVAGISLRRRIGSADEASEWLTERTQPLLRSLLLVAAVLALPPLAASLPVDRSLATFLACAAATIAVVGLRREESSPGHSRFAAAIGLGVGAGALVSGLTAYGLSHLSKMPLTLGIARHEREVGALGFFSIALLTPLFQEILFRERILGQLRVLCGSAWAVILSSALFTVSHLALDAMAIAFAGGLVAGVVMVRTRSLPLVIGMHMGWNAGVLMRVGAVGIIAAAVAGCASERSETRPSTAEAKQAAPHDSENYLRYIAFELPFGDAVLLRWSERQMPLRIFLTPPPEGLFADSEAYLGAIRDGVHGWSGVAGKGMPRFEFVDQVGSAHIPIAWASEPQGDWYIAHTIFNVVPSQRRFNVAQLLVTARWQDGRVAGPDDVRRVVLHEMGHALGFAGHSPDPTDIMYATVSATDLSARDRATLSALYARPVGARVTGAKGARFR